MCQSKADGGRRCASWTARHEVNPGTGTSSPSASANGWVCSRCGTTAVRGGRPAHRCTAPNLVPLTPATRVVLAAIESTGGHPILVGGSVRDALIADGEPFTPKDVDIEVYGGDYNSMCRALLRVGSADDVGESFGVLKAVVNGEDFDISLPRVDSKVEPGHRGFDVRVDHTLDEVAAFGRRDFTVNAMGWDPATSELVDPYGGTADLKAGILRHTTDAFREDPLRVLRGVQFCGRFGFTLAPETVTECRALTGAFKELPTERVWAEWAKVATKAPWPSKSLEALHDTGWETHFPELAAVRGVAQDPTWHPEGAVEVHTGMAADKAAQIAVRDGLDEQDRLVLVLGALTHDLGKAGNSQVGKDGRITSYGHAEAGGPIADAFLARIGAPNTVREHVSVIVREHMCHTTMAGPTAPAVRRLMRRLDGRGTGPALAQWARVVEADNGGRGAGSRPSPATAWLDLADQLGAPRPPASILRGEHLMAKGLRPGPAFRPILDAAIAAQDDGTFDDEAGAITWLGDYLRNAGQERVT